MVAVDWESDPGRWVELRSDRLSSADVGFRDSVAEAIAWAELGYSASGVAKRTDVSDSTASKYLDRASDVFPGILLRSVVDFDGDPDAGVDDLPDTPDRQCPVCLKGRLVGAGVADTVFSTSGWGSTAMIEDADLCCSFCHAVRINGVWERAETVNSRAYQLGQVSGSKDASDYEDILTRGIDPGATTTTTDSGDGSGEIDGVEW